MSKQKNVRFSVKSFSQHARVSRRNNIYLKRIISKGKESSSVKWSELLFLIFFFLFFYSLPPAPPPSARLPKLIKWNIDLWVPNIIPRLFNLFRHKIVSVKLHSFAPCKSHYAFFHYPQSPIIAVFQRFPPLIIL